MAVHFDGDATLYTGDEVDIGLAFALYNGYRVSAASCGLDGSKDKLTALYDHGVKWGVLQRSTSAGTQTSWVLPTEGRWPTVAEARAAYAASPPDTSWMDTPPCLRCYLLDSNNHLAG
jgi:hypothetical protein